MVRNTRRGMPRPLRVAPIYDFAQARIQGRLRPRTEQGLKGAA